MLLSSITLENILSFKLTTLHLKPLNVLIGPNAAGKSNLIDCIRLLQAAPVNLNAAIIAGGGAREWIWKGDPDRSLSAALACRIMLGQVPSPFTYRLQFGQVEQGLSIEGEGFTEPKSQSVYFDRIGPNVTIGGHSGQVSPLQSVLSTFKSPTDPTPVTRLGRELEQIRIYKEFNTGRMAQARVGISAMDVRKDFLEDGGDNLALVLHEMTFDGTASRVRDYLPRFSEQFEDVRVRLAAGSAQTCIKERGLRDLVPSFRLSDGTLKFLCLLAILLHSKPPSLICIEEPELGLHPDAITLVAEALLDASHRTQLIVTTHSDALVDAFSDHPEAIVVCERKSDDGTEFERLKPKELQAWLKRYKLGELWRKGEIGGNRW